MYRVYNKIDKKWVKDNIYLSPAPYNELYVVKKTILGGLKLVFVDDEDFVIHRDIGLHDDSGILIYEGDYVEARVSEKRIVKGIVAYAHEISAYVILCSDIDEYFTLGSEVSEFISVIGNVFDGFKEESKDGRQAL